MINDIFEFLKNKIGCCYISDMQFGNTRIIAIKTLEQIDKSRIENKQYQDVCRYLEIGG